MVSALQLDACPCEYSSRPVVAGRLGDVVESNFVSRELVTVDNAPAVTLRAADVRRNFEVDGSRCDAGQTKKCLSGGGESGQCSELRCR